MSWDIFVQDLPPGIQSIDDISVDFEPSSIWLRSEIIAKFCTLYPECDFTNGSRGILKIPGCSIEFNLGSDDKLDGFAMHVRGDERAPNIVAHILDALGMRAIDPSSPSGLFTQAPILQSDSFARWRSYRDQIVRTRDGQN